MSYTVGSLVSVRGREWIVLPDSDDEFLRLRPLSGRDEEVTAVLTALEKVDSANFDLPDPTQAGDFRSARLLREAARLGFRGSAGPFRSFGRIAVDPRPYQLVPLLVALKQNPVRILIADDVGIGKTVEAGLIARELLDRGETERLAVLCPPQLVEQWQEELRDKFQINAEALLPSTIRRLESQCIGESVFDHFPFLVISIDFIKSDRYRYDFVRGCPDLVIVDEAHTCAWGDEQARGRHQRHQLINELSRNENRHLILVTATPHSGKDQAFRSLIELLNPQLAELPSDLGGEQNRQHRQQLAQYFVQRRRADIRHFMKTDTPFPEREEAELNYQLSKEYGALFSRVLEFAKETVQSDEGGARDRRIRWWSALALLRSLASSPAAAASTLRNRATSADADNDAEIEDLGRRTVMDLLDGEAEEVLDIAPGADSGGDDDEAKRIRRRLLDMARDAEKLRGSKDAKLQNLFPVIKGLLEEGFSPIIFCRFIPTAIYVAEAIRDKFKNVEVAAITGNLPPADRERQILELGKFDQRILVATDCLSEGINLQHSFNAVIHYDLAWNPTRHEQREGRVDRYGQPKKIIRVLTYYGKDNQIDGIVLEVLIRKHQKIRKALGVSVPMPVDSAQIMEAILEGLLLRNGSGGEQYSLPGFEPERDALFNEWENVSESEKRSRTMFAQETIKVEEVAKELAEVQAAIGLSSEVEWFVKEAIKAHGGTVTSSDPTEINIQEVSAVLRDQINEGPKFTARFELPVTDKEIYLNRTSSIVESLANYVLDTALDPIGKSVARRCGVIRTESVEKRTTLLMLRIRYSIVVKQAKKEHKALTEECRIVAFEGPVEDPIWLDDGTTEELLEATPDQNMAPDQIARFLSELVEKFHILIPALEQVANTRATKLLESHNRARAAAKMGGQAPVVTPFLPVDVLGMYVFMPIPKNVL